MGCHPTKHDLLWALPRAPLGQTLLGSGALLNPKLGIVWPWTYSLSPTPNLYDFTGLRLRV